MKIVVSIYSHPEYYPPTLNAINLLSNEFGKVDVIYNNVLKTEWVFKDNVTLHPVGSLKPHYEIEKSNKIFKIIRWIKFTYKIYKRIKYCDIFCANDPIPLFSYFVASLFTSKKPTLIWYHNHDVHQINELGKYSIGWFSAKFEPKFFKCIDIFSLPSIERISYFPIDNLKGFYFLVPNYPLLAFYSNFMSHEDESTITLLLQGNISPGHGIEELLNLLPTKISNKKIKLCFKGHIKKDYKQQILNKAEQNNILDDVTFVGVTPYHEVPETTIKCQIGIAIFTNIDIMNNTLGSASNKIYEYAACGLPILYYQNEHFSKYLKNYNWAIPTDLTQNSFISAIQHISDNYYQLSSQAKQDFKTELNFDKNFLKLLAKINEKLK